MDEPSPQTDEIQAAAPTVEYKKIDLDKMRDWMVSPNLVDEVPQDLLGALGSKCKQEYDIDVTSRHKWVEDSRRAMELAMQISEPKQYPWPKASNVIYPLMTTSSIQFAARAYPAIISGPNVVKGVVIGPDNGEPLVNPQTGQQVVNPQNGQPAWKVQPGSKRIRANKVGEHMSYQLLTEQPEWEPETDKLLHLLPIIGCAFRKTYHDPTKLRNVSIMVPALQVVISYHAKSLETAPRITEEIFMYPLEIEEAERAGLFRHIEYSAPSDNVDAVAGDADAPQMFLEQHRYVDFDEDGYAEPYVVTVHKDTQKIVRIVARYDDESIMLDDDQFIKKINPVHYYTKYDFLPNPDGGIYGIGFGQLLRPINEAANTTLNMLIDAGHLANTGGGFVGKGMSMHTGTLRFVPGEYKAVNVPGSTIKDNVVPLEFPGPSSTLFNLLGTLIEAGKDIAAVKDVLTGEQKGSNIPASTTLALIEQGLKVFTAIYKRIHRSLKSELEKLYRLNRIHLDEMTGYRVGDEWHLIGRSDYVKGSGVEPISDPSMVSDMQKLGRAQFLLTFAQDPMFKGMEIRKRVLDAASIERPDDLLNLNPPADPKVVKDAMDMEIKGERVKAEAIKDYSQAVLFLAQAAAVEGAHDLGWVNSQLDFLKLKLEGLTDDHVQGSQPPAVPGMAQPPGDAGLSQVSGGLPGGPQGGGLGALAGRSPPPAGAGGNQGQG